MVILSSLRLWSGVLVFSRVIRTRPRVDDELEINCFANAKIRGGWIGVIVDQYQQEAHAV